MSDVDIRYMEILIRHIPVVCSEGSEILSLLTCLRTELKNPLRIFPSAKIKCDININNYISGMY